MHGFLGFIGIAKESTLGTAVGATDYMEAFSEGMSMTFDRFATKNIHGRYEEPADEAGVKRISGDIQVAGYPAQIGHLLRGALQTSSTEVVEAGELWAYNMKSLQVGDEFHADSPFQPYTLEIGRNVTSSMQYKGCVVNALTMNFQPNQDVRFTAEFLAQDEGVITATTPTFPNSPVSPFRFDTASVEIGGAANAKLESLTVAVRNNLNGIAKLNGSNLISAYRMSDMQMVEVSGSLEFDSVDEYLDFRNQTEQQLKCTVTQSNSFAMTIDVPRMVYTAFPTGTGGRDRRTVDFTGRAFYHTGSATAIAVTLTTTNSAY